MCIYIYVYVQREIERDRQIDISYKLGARRSLRTSGTRPEATTTLAQRCCFATPNLPTKIIPAKIA